MPIDEHGNWYKPSARDVKPRNRKERAEQFLKELTKLSKQYGFDVVAEGSPTLLSDNIEGGWIEFGKGWFSDSYKIEED